MGCYSKFFSFYLVFPSIHGIRALLFYNLREIIFVGNLKSRLNAQWKFLTPTFRLYAFPLRFSVFKFWSCLSGRFYDWKAIHVKCNILRSFFFCSDWKPTDVLKIASSGKPDAHIITKCGRSLPSTFDQRSSCGIQPCSSQQRNFSWVEPQPFLLLVGVSIWFSGSETKLWFESQRD